MHKDKTIRKSSRISGNFPYFLKFFFRSENFPFYPGTFQTVWKFSRLSENLPGCPEIFQAVQKSSTLQKSSRLFRTFSKLLENLVNCPEILNTVSKSSRLLGNLQESPEHLSDCTEIFQTVQKFSRQSGNLPDCLQIFQTDIFNIFFYLRLSFLDGLFEWQILFFAFFQKLSARENLSRQQCYSATKFSLSGLNP